MTANGVYEAPPKSVKAHAGNQNIKTSLRDTLRKVLIALLKIKIMPIVLILQLIIVLFVVIYATQV